MMNRRELLKSLITGTLGTGFVLREWSSDKDENPAQAPFKSSDTFDYGRTPEEKARDKELMSWQFFTEEEMKTITVLCGLVLPATETAGSAVDAEVPDFIEFIVKDIPRHQTPMRGGLMWLDNRCKKFFNKPFVECSKPQQEKVLDEIAYPDKAKPEVEQGVHFFSLFRNLTLTGYYTSEMGINDLGYKGNTPNVWDGVPPEVLKEHDVDYDPEWLKKCIDQERRSDIAKWDEEGNLIN